jgi:hypothetical protein
MGWAVAFLNSLHELQLRRGLAIRLVDPCGRAAREHVEGGRGTALVALDAIARAASEWIDTAIRRFSLMTQRCASAMAEKVRSEYGG